MKNSDIREKYKDFDEEEYCIVSYGSQNEKLNYKKYVTDQTSLNRKKLHLNGPSEDMIKQLSHFVNLEWGLLNHKPKFGLCHGTRRGHEQKYFSKYLKIPVLGTDISDTAETFLNTIEWDFHNTIDDWVNNVDFIYSNALDHSYDPIYCLKQWFKCLRPGGICILAYEKKGHNLSKDAKSGFVNCEGPQDGFQGSLDFYEKIIKIAGEAEGLTVLRYILNTEYMLPSQIVWLMEKSQWGIWDYHLVIQKLSNDKREDIIRTVEIIQENE